MPIYAYRCEACGHAKDVLQKISDPLLTVCPACAADAFRKQLTAAGFQLKGSGWYVTDFRDGKKPAADAAATKPGDPAAPAAKPDATTPTSAEGAGAQAAPAASPAAAPSSPAAPPAPSSGPAASTAA